MGKNAACKTIEYYVLLNGAGAASSSGYLSAGETAVASGVGSFGMEYIDQTVVTPEILKSTLGEDVDVDHKEAIKEAAIDALITGAAAYVYSKSNTNSVEEQSIYENAHALEKLDDFEQLKSETFCGKQNVSIVNNDTSSIVPDKGYNSFNDLKLELGSPGEGNAWHHIVEQSQISKSRFTSNQVNNINNVISIPHGKGTVHAKISGYYSSKQFFTGGKTVRKWLAGQSFQDQFDFGMNLLEEYGTVTPTTEGWEFTPF